MSIVIASEYLNSRWNTNQFAQYIIQVLNYPYDNSVCWKIDTPSQGGSAY